MTNPKTLKETPLVRVVDDDPGVRDALAFLLGNEGWRVATYPDAESFLAGDAPSDPGCLVLDVKMPGMTGPELQAELVRRGFIAPIVFLSAHGDIDMAVKAMWVGAFDFIPKPIDPPRLIKAVADAVAEDRRRRLGLPTEAALKARLSQLTERERQILRYAVRGLANREIAEALNVSPKTVEAHKTAVFRRLDVQGAAEAKALLDAFGAEV